MMLATAQKDSPWRPGEAPLSHQALIAVAQIQEAPIKRRPVIELPFGNRRGTR